jgi:acetyl/propionyl-CoA carboxylase alpha subunit/acetyl-CoA carboxylase carboxyltransferase component
MTKTFKRIAIINRGEPAMRFIHAVRKYNRSHGTQLQTVIFYTAPDRHANFVREADDAFDLGEAACLNRTTGQREQAYLNYPRLRHALSFSGVDAVWVGWGFVAERPEFAELCRQLGLVFIGPGPAAMKILGDKISAKKLAESIGIPVVPWAGDAAADVHTARDHAKRLGYPVAVKAAAGEGGRGIRKVLLENDLPSAFQAARNEASRLFGNSTVYIEKWMESAHHVEVQVLADESGNTWAIGTRDCTIQRRHQKIVEEAPAIILKPKLDKTIRAAAVDLCRAAGYQNAGTVEFLYDPATRRFALMEVNTRLQVEHPVTELTTGMDLVQMQLHLAMGGKLDGAPPKTKGHAVEVRLNAEDPENGFSAAPGKVDIFRLPTSAGLRLDTGIMEGDSIPAEYDSMFAKLISFGENRAEATDGLIRGLEETSIVVTGGATNRSFLMKLLGREEVQKNEFDVDWLDRLTSAGGHISVQHAEIALVQAAIEVYDEEFEQEREEFFASAARMKPVVRIEPGRSVELRYRGNSYRFAVYRSSLHHYRLDIEGTRLDVDVDRSGKMERWLTCGGKRYRIVYQVQNLTHYVEVNGSSYIISRDEGSLIRASAPSVVVSIEVSPGDSVVAGDRVAILEAMKMEIPILAPFAGTVKEVFVLNNSQVGPGTALMRINPAAAEGQAGTASGISFAAIQSPAQIDSDPVACLRGVLADIRLMVLGSDVHPSDARKLVEEYSRLSGAISDAQEEVILAEDEILEIFTNISSLFRRQVTPEDPEDEERLSTGEYLMTYLRTLNTRGAGLPRSFIEKLQRTLNHYGSNSLEPSAALKEKLLWIYRSHQHMELQVPAIMAILEKRLNKATVLASKTGQPFLLMLDRIMLISENRFPALMDLAHDVHYRFFEQPLFERARDRIYAEMKERLLLLAGGANAEDRGAHMDALVNCPYPMKTLLADIASGKSALMRALILEVMTRRYYRIRNIKNVRTTEIGRKTLALAEYDHNGKCVHLAAMEGSASTLLPDLTVLNHAALQFPAADDVVADLYVNWDKPFEKAESVGENLLVALQANPFSRPVRRVAFAVTSAAKEGGTAVRHFTFRLSEYEYAEDKIYCGLHPMLSKRLQLWRLSNFNIERLPSAEDVYLFRCLARENPKDERLFAIAEVRDLTPVRDNEGHIIQLPHLERMLMESLTAIRQVQLRRAPEERYQWNRVLMYIRPPARLSSDELQSIARRLARQTEGLGLEKVVLRANLADMETGELRDTILSISKPGGHGIEVRFSAPGEFPVRPLTEYSQKVVRMRQRGLNYPYEVLKTLTPDSRETHAELPHGEFLEYDLDKDNRLVPVNRSAGCNRANVVVGLIRNFTEKYPEGMTRVILLGDPSKEMGSIAEPECRRILAALDLAEKMKVPLEWFSLSAGAKISMQSGTENMDWIAWVLRRLIEFTQAGNEVNVIVTGINVGAQPYWNAEATMLMHTRGILIMMPESAMVLTGKTALDYSGSVSAEDNQGIGGYEHVMGPNGQAQYWAQDLAGACKILMSHYDHTYIALGERFPRRAKTGDPLNRDVRKFPHGGGDSESFALVGDVFSDEKNPGRKKPFDIRRIMLSVTDQDNSPLERWTGMEDAEVAVVWDAHIGGYPVCLLGFESRSMRRIGFVATDGPERWTSGTLFPMASKKTARSINACSNNRPLVILANLSGFDGSPESMRRRQLEFGAEIGRSIVNFKGPIVFCVISRYHGGAFVVFSKALNENMEVVALEGTYASVIGGAPAAAVVFARDVDTRTRKDARLLALEQQIAAAGEAEKRRLRGRYTELRKIVRSEKLGEVAEEFDRIHSVQRALKVGSLDRIIPALELRSYLIDAIERGMQKEMERVAREILPGDSR